MKKAGSVKAMAAAAVTSVIMIGGAVTAQAGETSFYVKSGWYTWSEKINGASFVKEKGFLHGVGVTRRDTVRPITIGERFEVWGGNLDYDGHDVTGTVPLKSDTNYLGTREEFALSAKIPQTTAASFEPFAAIGHKFWIRTRSGEDWNTFYGKVGAAGEYAGRSATFYVKGGAILPLYTRNHVDLSTAGLDDVVTEPKSRISAFAEGGVKAGAFTVSVEYEGLKFGESAKVPTHSLSSSQGTAVVNGQAYQPASTSTFVSLKVTYTF